MRRLLTFSALVLAATALAPATAAAAGPVFGVADDGAKYADDGGSNFFLTLADLGFTSNRITVTWDPTDGSDGLTIRERAFLDRAVPIAALRGIDLVLDVYPVRARAFAVDTDNRITLFAEYLALLARTYPTVRTFIVGNEPNQPRFLQPQFVRSGRRYRPVAGALFEHVLAAAYDALKDVDPGITVVGLGLSPRGNDDPRATSNISRSPVRFIADLAAEYRRSGRTKPLMDELGFHPYPNSNDDPLSRGYSWPDAGMAELARIKQAVWDGFHDTAQPVFHETPPFGGPPTDTGPSLGLVLDEYGRQVTVISSVARVYHGHENVPTISEARQAIVYTAVLRQAECDPDVRGFFFFHLIDESDLDRFQSGLLRADGTKRPSYDAVKATLEATNGVCSGALKIWRHSGSVVGADVTFGDASLTVRAAEAVTASTGFLPASLTESQMIAALSRHGRTVQSASVVGVRAYRNVTIPLRPTNLAAGVYVQAVVLRAAMNSQRTFLAVSDPFTVG